MRNNKQIGFRKPAKPPTIKERLSQSLTNEDLLEFITYVQLNEIDRLGILISLVNDENEIRKQLGIGNKIRSAKENTLGHNIDEILLLRTSKEGWRAIQIENVIAALNKEKDEEKKNNMIDIIRERLKI